MDSASSRAAMMGHRQGPYPNLTLSVLGELELLVALSSKGPTDPPGPSPDPEAPPYR
eukprot:CAMPEP_0170069458 /NCGR_PEP_ID=MMETSP0019_2-20121128/8129_1 /TAXON_ID=98059 /ORGANISM="Dinobryon sp., Strain UTEXLB2267" /LENGTH=56 /DNA_ID=CAMNT_0010277515 /DNA_START=469 /DNA_END=639 /DNA_ORIENTATION=+